MNSDIFNRCRKKYQYYTYVGSIVFVGRLPNLEDIGILGDVYVRCMWHVHRMDLLLHMDLGIVRLYIRDHPHILNLIRIWPTFVVLKKHENVINNNNMRVLLFHKISWFIFNMNIEN